MVMATPAKVNISDVIDNTKIGQYQIGVFVLITACLMMDGFDVQALGYVAPAIVRDFGVGPAALAPVFAATNFGFLIGSLLFSMMADKVGRRPVLLLATAFFAVMTIMTARAASVQELLIFRFIAGIGLGSIIPQCTALVSEYSPRRSRITAMMITTTIGFNGGAMLSGLVSARLIEALGWRSVFYVGGILPLIIALFMFFWLPESMQFLVLRNKGKEKIARWLKRISPQAVGGSSTEYVVQEENKGGVPAVHLFQEGRTMRTILIWIINFMNLLILFALASWIPTVVRDAGYPISVAVLVGTTLQIGGIFGTFVLAWAISKRGFLPVLTASLTIACISVALIGQPGLSLALLTAVVAIAGAGIIGSQPAINALSAMSYPTYLRSTGVGWGLGIGRIGAIVGPVIGGMLIARQWSNQDMFLAAALPALISTLGIVCMRWAKNPAANSPKSAATAH